MGGISCLFDRLALAEQRSKTHAAYAYMLLGHLLMVCMWSLFKWAMNQGVDYNQVLYYRGAIVFLFNSFVIARLKHAVYPESEAAQKTLFVRSIVQLFSPLLQFYGISQLHISDATVLSLTGPIWVQLTSWLMYGEKLDRKNYLLTLLSFIGIVFVSRPQFIFGGLDDDNGNQSGEKNRLFGCVMMLIGSMSLAVSQSLMKGLQGKTSNFVAMQYFYVTNLMATPLCMMYKETNDVRLIQDKTFIAMLLIITIIAYAGQFMLSRGLMMESPARLSQLAYTRIIYAFLIDLLVFTVEFNVLSLIGFAFIVVSSINIVRAK